MPIATPDRNRPRKRKRPAPRPHPVGVFARPPVPRVDPIQQRVNQARQRTARARRKLPPLVVAQPPILKHPTRKQTQVANRLVAKSITANTRGTGRERVEQRAQVNEELLSDPRYRAALKAAQHYGNIGRDQQALQLAKSYGVRGSRAQKVRAGHALALARARSDRVSAKPKRGARDAPGALLATVLAQTSLGSPSAENQFVKNIGGDVKSLAEGPFIGGYEVGAGLVDVARGRGTKRLQRLAKGVGQGISHSVPGELLIHGDPEAALQQAREHPLQAVLDLAATGALAGRGVGAAARGIGKPGATGIRGAADRIGTTVRPPVALVDDAGAVREGAYKQRTYAKGSDRKAVQAFQDSKREYLKDAEGNVVTVEDRGRRVPVLRGTPKERVREQKRQADYDAAHANSNERMIRDEAAKEMHVRGIKGRRAKDLVSMVVEGTITTAKHFKEDLRAHRDRLLAEVNAAKAEIEATGKSERYKTRDELKAAVDRIKLADEALKDSRVLSQAGKIVAAGEDIGRRLNAREAEAIKLGLLHPVRAARSRLVPAAVEHLGARHYTPEELRAIGRVTPTHGQMSILPEDILLTREAAQHGGLRHGNGQFIGNGEIEKFLSGRGRDPGTVAYLPHRLDTRGGRAFHTQFRPGTRTTFDKAEVRTGSAYAKGTTEASTDLIKEQGVKQAIHITKAKLLDKSIGTHGTRRPDGRYFTAKEAMATAERIEADTGERFVPVRAFPAKLDAETQKIIRENLQGPGGMDTLGQRLLNDRIIHAPDVPGAVRARNVVLMPADYIERLNRHLQPAGGIQRFLQFLNRPFRFAVLAQPRWLVGNFVEPYIVRLTTIGSGVNVFGLGVDIAAATRSVRRMERSGDPALRQAAKEIRAHQFGGLFGGNRGASVRRTGADLPGPLKYASVVRQLPVMKQTMDVLSSVLDSFFRVNRLIEAGAQRAAYGHQVRADLREFTGSWIATMKLQAKALDEVNHGLLNTATQRRFTEMQHEVLGKYEGFSPWMRELIQGPMPFVPWMLNAARFTFWTLPAHRTIQTALLLKVNDVVAKDWKEIHSQVPPGSLKLAVPTKKGGWIDLARYTPWGLSGPAAEGDLGGVDQILPQLQGPSLALTAGLDPFGRPIKKKPTASNPTGAAGVADRGVIAANELAEALIPYVSTIRRLREGGGTPYTDSNVFSPKTKPGTKRMSAVRRTFDPFRPTYLHPAPAGSGSSRSTAATPTSRAQELLERRAALLNARSTQSSRMQDLLERRARLLESR